MYTYPWYHWIAFFYIYCFFGWIFESAYVSLKKGCLVNRGFLRLPMLPLYGTGAVMMLWVSLPVKDSLILVYLSGVVAATSLEYVTGYMMERLFKMKYWDYSNQRFQINGYICLTSSIAWGFLTIFLTEVIHRPIAAFILNMDPFLEFFILTVVSVVFVLDVVQSTREALALGQALEAMTRMKGQLDEMQLQLALLRAEAAQKLEDMKSDARMQAAELRNDAHMLARELKSDAWLRVEELRSETALLATELRDAARQKAAEFKEDTAHMTSLLKDSVHLPAGKWEECPKESLPADSETDRQKACQTPLASVEEAAFSELSSGPDLEHMSHPGLSERIQAQSERVQALLESRRKLYAKMSFYRRGLLKGNPTASSSKFGEALKELRDMADRGSHGR
ncbi:MAG: hypothetical protein HFG72_09870 [Hungatella sp.]|jgi:uncharacterized membrane protein|nr:hypothetical protein [Hungatella sp.]